ncbi:MAG: hypothetical protein WCI31_01595 [Prolixibacteraceae bacterium]
MNSTFALKKGTLVFNDGKIIITDNAKRQKWYRLVTSGMWTFYGALSVLRYFKTGDQYLLWTGLFIGIAHFGIFVAFLFRSVQSEVALKDVKSMKLKSPFGDVFLDIKLNNNRIRRVSQVENEDELQGFIDKISVR